MYFQHHAAGIVCALCAAFVLMPTHAADTSTDTSVSTAANNPAPVRELPEVQVISTAPLPGLGLPINEVPSNVQTVSSKDLKRQQPLTLADYLNENLSGISVNETQNNPFQLNVNYHGFTASPLLGTPEGISVFQDGVRVNESFGDVVNWGLIPRSAIANVTLSPGSNPVYGLNTLGGALAIQTKSGHDFPGTSLQVSGGSFGRRDFEAQTGGSIGHFDYFLTGNYLDGDGWRDDSPSHVRQLFGKVGWENATSDIDLSYTWADTNLIGNGVTPQSLLAHRREAIFTSPDMTQNHLNFINLNASHFFLDTMLLSGNLYYRKLGTHTFNGDFNDDYEDAYDNATAPGGSCAAIANPGPTNCPALSDTGVNHGGHLRQRRLGAGLQLTDSQSVFGLENQGVLGISFDRAHQSFSQYEQDAALTSGRATIATGGRNPVTQLGGKSQTTSVYVTDTLSPTDWLHLTASARYNRLYEKLNGLNIDPDSGATNPLIGNHSFHRINPALGFTLTPTSTFTFYANYNEGSRAPTVIELGCANPLRPCGLPNAFADDPPLKPVVARTFEVGARGQPFGHWLHWSIGLFHTRSKNDIEFITTAAAAGQGFFDNVGDTRRQGGDLSLSGTAGKLHWRLNYSFVDATYQSSFDVAGESNSTADSNGEIAVRPGDRLPLVPRHTGRLILDYQLMPKWHVGANLILSSGAYLLGNQNNRNRAGGTNASGDTVIGSGRIGGYAVLNLRSNYTVTNNVDVFLLLDNVFDRDYATSGFLSENPFNANGSFRNDPDDWTNENAVSPAHPRAVWAGVRVHW